MRNVFDTVCREVNVNGAKFSVDFKSRSLKLNGEYLIKNGEVLIERGMPLYVPEHFLFHIRDFYSAYRHSIPSERSESRGRNYFKALPEKDLSDQDMLYGQHREFCRSQLEVYILCCMMEGAKWDDSWGKWFWHDTDEPNLILLRTWFEEPVKAEGV